jgi:hypothetical protein
MMKKLRVKYPNYKFIKYEVIEWLLKKMLS